jgi:hypothetical protein
MILQIFINQKIKNLIREVTSPVLDLSNLYNKRLEIQEEEHPAVCFDKMNNYETGRKLLNFWDRL